MAKAKSNATKKAGSDAKKLPPGKSRAAPKTPKVESKPEARSAKLRAAIEKVKGKGAAKQAEAETESSTSAKAKPRATKLPAVGQPLTPREMEQMLTAGAGRGVFGEGSLKGKLLMKEGLPHLQVVGRDKRELTFLLQGPDQEILPAYVDHKVSVTGLIKKTTNYTGTVDVRKYAAKSPEAPAPVAPPEAKLRYLSPGDVEQVCNSGMGAGMRGFATLRGNLEMTGEEFFLVVSNAGTRQQVSFLLQGKTAKGLRKYLGQPVSVTGVVDKGSGWGGTVQVEGFEPRPLEYRAVSRDGLEVVQVEGGGSEVATSVKLNHGLSIRLPERAGHTWAVEPTTAKRVGLREANFEPSPNGAGTREFFFTPRNPGSFEVDFFLAKAFSPAQVAKTFRLQVTVTP